MKPIHGLTKRQTLEKLERINLYLVEQRIDASAPSRFDREDWARWDACAGASLIVSKALRDVREGVDSEVLTSQPL